MLEELQAVVMNAIAAASGGDSAAASWLIDFFGDMANSNTATEEHVAAYAAAILFLRPIAGQTLQ